MKRITFLTLHIYNLQVIDFNNYNNLTFVQITKYNITLQYIN